MTLSGSRERSAAEKVGDTMADKKKKCENEMSRDKLMQGVNKMDYADKIFANALFQMALAYDMAKATRAEALTNK